MNKYQAEQIERLLSMNDRTLKATKWMMMTFTLLFLALAIAVPVTLVAHVGIVPALWTILSGLAMKWLAHGAYQASRHIVQIRHIQQMRIEK